MQAKTRNSLLGYGLTADLADLVATKGHTVTLLRAMNKSQLVDAYGEHHAAVITDRLRRKPIDDVTMDALVAEADGCCCICADGNSTRPYEIHHIDEYAATQDNSKQNLLLVCPTHHQTVHDQNLSKAEQTDLRSSWHALVRVAKDYRGKGLSFPYGMFGPINYGSPASIAELVEFVRVSPSTACLVCPPEIVQEALRSGTTGNTTVIQGRSGAGKSTLALAVAGRLGCDRKMFYYRPAGDPRAALAEIMTFLRAVSHRVGLILDDANSYCTQVELHDLAAAAPEEVHLVVVWAPAERDDDDRGISTGRYVTVTWQDIKPTLRSLLLEHELEVVDVLQRLSPRAGIDKVGIGGFQDSLEGRIDKYAATAGTVSEFLFLLRGGDTVAGPILKSLHDRDRADVPVLYAAAEQIAGFERAVSPEETAEFLKGLRFFPQVPVPTANWISEVFEREARKQHMVHRRGVFTTPHRDWAQLLLAAGLKDNLTQEATRELVGREFDIASADLARMSAMWSWLWSAGGAGAQFVHEWAAKLDREQWILLVSRSCTKGIESIGFVAGRMHLLLHRTDWNETVARAMEANENGLISCLQAATASDWYYINELFMAVDHVSPALGNRLRVEWGSAHVATLLMSTGLENIHRAAWCFGDAKSRYSEWCQEVCDYLEWPRIVENFKRIRPGAMQDVCETWGMLEGLGYPMRRSMLKACVDAMCGAIANARLKEMRLHGIDGLMMLLWVYPDEADRILASIDDERLAAELATSHPRLWNQLDWVNSFAQDRLNFVWRPLELVDIDALAKNIALYAPHAPYEFRCLIWLLGLATELTRRRLAAAIETTVEKVMRESNGERDDIARAFLGLSAEHAEKLFAVLRAEGVAVNPDPLEEQHRNRLMPLVERLRARDLAGQDYLVHDAFSDRDAT
jgi:hypothetical protein